MFHNAVALKFFSKWKKKKSTLHLCNLTEILVFLAIILVIHKSVLNISL